MPIASTRAHRGWQPFPTRRRPTRGHAARRRRRPLPLTASGGAKAARRYAPFASQGGRPLERSAAYSVLARRERGLLQVRLEKNARLSVTAKPGRLTEPRNDRW